MEYNFEMIANRIKSQAKSKHVPLKIMLSDLNLGINLISHFAKGQNMTSINLAKIADYLDVSIDYLMCRTDNPEINR